MSTKPSPPVYATVNFSYHHLVLPFKDAIALLASLEHVEQITDDYNKPKRVHPTKDFYATFRVLTNEEYLKYKTNHLLLEESDEESS